MLLRTERCIDLRKYHYDLTHQGKTYLSIREAAEDLGINKTNLRYRLRASDLSLTKAMSKDWSRFGFQGNPRTYKYRDRIFKSVFEISDEYGFAYHMLKRLLVNHSLEEIIDNKMLKKKGSRKT